LSSTLQPSFKNSNPSTSEQALGTSNPLQPPSLTSSIQCLSPEKSHPSTSEQALGTSNPLQPPSFKKDIETQPFYTTLKQKTFTETKETTNTDHHIPSEPVRRAIPQTKETTNTDHYIPSEAVRRAIARGKDASRGSIVAAIQSAEQNILTAINDLKQTIIKDKRRRRAGPPFF